MRAAQEHPDRPLELYERLLTEAAPLEADEPARAAVMLAEAAVTALRSGEHERSIETSGRARRLAELGDDAQALALTQLSEGVVLAVAGRGDAALRRALEQVDLLDVSLDGDVGRAIPVGLIVLEEYDVAVRVLEAVATHQRRRRSPDLALSLDTLAALDFRTGRWPSAHARSSEAARISRNDASFGQLASCLTTLARIAAARGDEQECRARAAEALELVSTDDLIFAYAVSAVGQLELGLGRPAEAATTLERLSGVAMHADRDPLVVQWLPDLVEAYVRSDRPADAEALAEGFERRALEGQRPWLRAAASRCRGLLRLAGFDEDFRDALSWHARTRSPFELARTELCYGERLRRARRGPEARPLLRSALATFERIGASGWAARARRELAPARRSRPESDDPAERLTPHELQVTVLVARGARNREAAAALFVSEKTIEYHLASAYRKLGVRSRTELANVFR